MVSPLELLVLLEKHYKLFKMRLRKMSRIFLRYQAPPVFKGVPRRPRLCIALNQLAYLLESWFTCPQIANVLVVSLTQTHEKDCIYLVSIRMSSTVMVNEVLSYSAVSIQGLSLSTKSCS